MRFAPTDEQLEFRDAVRGLLDRVCTPDDVRSSWGGAVGEHTSSGSGDGRVPAAWSALAEMGVLGILVPESAGGLGMTDDDLVGLVVEAGWAGLPDPLADTAGVAAAALAAAVSASSPASEQARELLAGIAAGEVAVVYGLGVSPTVASAPTADAFLLARPGEALHLLRAGEVELEALDSVDGSRNLARVRWEPARPLLDGAPGVALAEVSHDRAATLTAASAVGVSRRMLAMAVEYATERHQFGVPIGSFQAVKHRLADAAMGVEFAEPLVRRAAHALALGEPASVHASMAKARASVAAQAAADASLQVHGAIGYTVECDLHLFLKRAWALSRQHGDAATHRARVREHLLAGAV